MKKKLLIATDSFLPRWDGVSRFLLEIMPWLEEDYDITIVAPDFPGSKKEDYKIERIPLSKFHAGDYILPKFKPKRIKKLVKESDIVFTQTIGPIGALAINYANKRGIPIVSYVHSIEWELVSRSISRPYLNLVLTNLTKILSRWLYNKSNLIMTPSKEVIRIFEKEKILAKKKVVYLGADTNKFVPADDKKEAKKKMGLDPEEIVIGFHGRIGREKDLMTLYKAFLRLQKEYQNLTLLIVGTGLKEQEILFKSAQGIKHIKYADNVVPYLQAMDIYVLPSLTETTSLSTLEAMSCGCAVLSTKVGLVKKYIKDKVNGSFFPKGNDVVLKLKLKWLIDNPEIREKFSENARATIVQKFDWKKTGKEIRKLLLSIL